MTTSTTPRAGLLALALLALAPAARAQTVSADSASAPPVSVATPGAVPPGAVPLTVEAAVEIALERGYAVRLAELDEATARAQVRQQYGTLFPTVDLSSSYTRNVVQANPFAGSSAGGLFGGLGAIGWLQFNETARTDGDPATNPITLSEYNDRIGAGQAAVGYDPASSTNPFGTDNSFLNAVSLSQPLYSGTAFAALRGARSLVEVSEQATEQRRDEAIAQARQAFYGALLAQARIEVQRASVERSRETSSDARLLVAQGVRPVLERLNAEVDLANAETALVTAEAQAAAALDALLLTLGMPVDAPVVLVGRLDEPPAGLFRTVGLAAASAGALDLRPDLQQARLAIRLQEVQRDITRAAAYPSLSAFVDFSYSGNIPDDRSFLTTPDEDDPFTFETGSTGFFSDTYWQPALSAGLRLNWTLFDGFQTRYRAQQNQIAVQQAEVRLEQATNAARLEVAGALRDLESAQRRLATQRQTVETARTAFTFASARLGEGVATQVDVRVASQNLDVARLNYLQAIYDALIARSAYERATGTIGTPAADALPVTAAR
jgi:outer membrane protein TolC